MSETQPLIMGGWYCGNRQGRGFTCPEQGCAKGFCARDAGWTPGAAGTIECSNSSAATGWNPKRIDQLPIGTKIEFLTDPHQCVTPTTNAAFVHAEDLAHATAELLRFAREGASTDRYPFGLDDIVSDLAQALLFALRTEVDALGTCDADARERELGQQLCASLAAWLEDSAGVAVED